MKQNHSGQRIVNWHRPYDHTQLSRGYLHCHATAWQRDLDDELFGLDYGPGEEWSGCYSTGLNYAYYAVRELLDQEAPQGLFWQFFVQCGCPPPPAPRLPAPAEVVVPAAQLAEQLAAYWRQLLKRKGATEWLPATAQQAIAATDLLPLRTIAARSVQGRAAAINLLLFRPFWVRSLRSWEPQGSCDRDRIATLIAHLLAYYPVPPFLHWEWMSEPEPDRTKWLCWAILLGQGQSLHRAAMHFGWELPRRLQPHLYAAPAQATTREACVYAEVLRLGGSAVEFQRLRLAEPFMIDPTEPQADRHFLTFWRRSVLWLIQHRQELSDQQAQVVLNWAMHQYTEALRTPGRSFTLIGRSVERVLAASVAYQRHYEQFDAAARASRAPQRWTGHGWDWSWEDAEQNQ